MLKFFRIKNPIFLNPVEFVGSEFSSGVIQCGGRGESLEHESRRERRVSRRQSSRLRLGEESQVRHEHFPDAQTHRYRLAVKLAEIFLLDI